jgi:hypothetical protein
VAALAAARAAVQVYTIGLAAPGVAIEPSAELIAARGATDDAVRALLASLPPPGS